MKSADFHQMTKLEEKIRYHRPIFIFLLHWPKDTSDIKKTLTGKQHYIT